MPYIIFKTKYTEGLDQPTFIPTGTTTVETNGTHNVANYEFIKVLVENKKLKKIACSRNTTWILKKNGELYGCGLGDRGQQGSGTDGTVTTFKKD